VLLSGLGTLYILQARYPDASKTLDRALAIVTSARNAVPLDQIAVLNVRATLHAQQEDWRAAAEDLRSAVSLADHDTQLNPADLKLLLVNFGHVLHKAHQGKEARSIEARAAALHAPQMANALVDTSELSGKRITRKK
jgi:hypothetical protein